jgi:hypothetical protein
VALSDISSDILYEKPAAYAKIELLIGGSENGIRRGKN